VAIARALVGSPELLLADEPTGNLDSASARQIMDLLGRINREDGMTIIMVTHDHELAARAHRKLHILDGRIIDPRAPIEAVS
jgi:putative ABC transport system ATP-binding protein